MRVSPNALQELVFLLLGAGTLAQAVIGGSCSCR